MRELLEPADPRGGNRALARKQESGNGNQESGTKPDSRFLIPDSSVPPLLLFEHVSKWYGPVIGVNQVTLELRDGITGLVGANGAGKSTLMRLATGQLRPDLGAVRVRGHA